MNDPVVFEDWETVLKAQVPPDRQRRYREAIVKFRYWLREKGKQPVVETFKEHLAWKQSYLSPERFAIRREALRWYYKTGTEREFRGQHSQQGCFGVLGVAVRCCHGKWA
jgi:hypothetical protein